MHDHTNTTNLATIGSITGVMTGLIFAMVGAALGLGGWFAIEQTRPPADGIETTALVVDVVENQVIIDGIARPTYAPVYVYEDVDGTTHRVVDRVSQGGGRPTVGSTIEVSYTPGDPESVRRTDLDTAWMSWLMWGGIAGAAGGVLMAVVSVAIGARAARRRRRARPAPVAVRTW